MIDVHLLQSFDVTSLDNPSHPQVVLVVRENTITIQATIAAGPIAEFYQSMFLLCANAIITSDQTNMSLTRLKSIC